MNTTANNMRPNPLSKILLVATCQHDFLDLSLLGTEDNLLYILLKGIVDEVAMGIDDHSSV